MRSAALVLLLLVPAPVQDVLVRKVVPDADKIKKVAKRIPPAGREKIEKALGETLAETDLAPALYECWSVVPSVSGVDRTYCRVVFVTAQGPTGAIKLGVAVAPLDSTLHAVKVLENADSKLVESPDFLRQFSGFEYTANVANAAGILAGALKKAGEGGDDASRELGALVRMSVLMNGMQPAYDRSLAKSERKDKTASEEAVQLDRMLDETLKLLPVLKFLKSTQLDKFRTFGAGGRSDLGEFKALAAAGKFEEAARKAGSLEADRCSRCHGAYKRLFREARLERAIGDGYFSTKLDVAVPDPSAEASYQAVASAVRKAILLSAEAR